MTTISFFRLLSGSSGNTNTDVDAEDYVDPEPDTDTCIVCLEPVGPDVTPASSTSSLYLPLLDDTRVFLSDTPMPPPCACKYHVHPACLAEWYRRHPTCPLCRVADDTPDASDTPRTSSPGAPTWIEELRASQRSRRTTLPDYDTVDVDRSGSILWYRTLCLGGVIGVVYILLTMANRLADVQNDDNQTLVGGKW